MEKREKRRRKKEEEKGGRKGGEREEKKEEKRREKGGKKVIKKEEKGPKWIFEKGKEEQNASQENPPSPRSHRWAGPGAAATGGIILGRGTWLEKRSGSFVDL